MKKQKILLILALSILPSCSSTAGEPDVDATVQAAVEATRAAEAQLESAVEAGVAATLTAMPTPTAAPISEMSEEELAQAVETSFEEAAGTSEQAAQTAEMAAEDGEITSDELEDLYYLYYLTIEEIEQALNLAEEYADIYGELLDLTLQELEAIEDELNAILQTSEEVLGTLDEIANYVEAGQAAAQETIDKLTSLAGQSGEKAKGLTEKFSGWMETRQGEFDGLAERARSYTVDNVSATRVGALAQARDYLEAVRQAVGDGRFSLEELENIGQLGANAAASLDSLGGDLSGLPGMIDGITRSFSLGQLPQVNSGLGSLQSALPSLK